MTFDHSQIRHATRLRALIEPLQSQGWTAELVPPQPALQCRAENASLPPVSLSYMLLDDESNELELMEITCDMPESIPDGRLDEVKALLHTLNSTLPLGALCLVAQPAPTICLRHVYAHDLRESPSAHDVGKMIEMIAGVTLVFQPMIRAVIEGQSAAEALGQETEQPANKPDSHTLLDQITGYLSRKNMGYDMAQDVAAIVLIQGKNGTFNLILQVREQERQIVAYSVGSSKTPPEQRHEMALFVTLANYGLFIGNFEMDLNDGEVRYKVSQDLGTQPLTDEILSRLIQSSVRAYDPYALGIRIVAEGRLSAREAVALIEG